MKSKSLHNLEKFKNNLFDESHKHEHLLNRICKYTLGIPEKSSNIAAKGELGIYHLNIECRNGMLHPLEMWRQP